MYAWIKRRNESINNNGYISKKQKNDAIKEVEGLAFDADKEMDVAENMDVVEKADGVEKADDVENMDVAEKEDVVEKEDDVENMDVVGKEDNNRATAVEIM